MEEQKFILEFEGVSELDANNYAHELESFLNNETTEASVQIARADPNKQDFGATLIIGILGTPAVIALAKRIGDWLKLRNSTTIKIKDESGELVAENISGNTAKELLDKWKARVQTL